MHHASQHLTISLLNTLLLLQKTLSISFYIILLESLYVEAQILVIHSFLILCNFSKLIEGNLHPFQLEVLSGKGHKLFAGL
ncbi:hypothetical protein FGO68_gene15668 [Halteria grandinella]|uniref:Uncharacterized protein n=1 Tax=Halteria grandinella TaxID=5974 RepID=A0A8J8T0K0_HALGN|nr:hypothetical protein FGO68_gene15668 [Halteria grandinella]